jgi:hypothetical protein
LGATLSSVDAERFRAYERRRHDSLAASYHDFSLQQKKEVVKKICCSTKYNEEFAARLDVVRPAALCSSSSSSMKAWTTASMLGSAAKPSARCGAAVSLFRATLGYVTNLS